MTNVRSTKFKRQIGVPGNKRIPVTLRKAIRKAKPGKVVKNPTKTGKARIRVTKTIKDRA